jgi:hypothetical protein
VTSAQGIDVSAFQPILTARALRGLDFAFAKATDGPWGTDPNFAANWAAIKAAGKHRGTYHELQAGNPAGQAAHFLAVVQPHGLEAGDMLACVASDYSAGDSDVRAFCDTVKSATGGRNRILVYSDLSVARTLTSCTGYDLWVAWPSGTPPASVAPWKTWRLWQWQMTGLDRDAYNGTRDEMAAWLAASPAPPAPTWTENIVQQLPVLKQGATGAMVRRVQGLLVAAGYDLGTTGPRRDGIDGTWGAATDKALRAAQKAAGIAADGICGQATWPVLLGVA